MCDLATMKKSSCHGSVGKRIGPVKLTKWELPIPRSKSYWDGVCAEIEKKHKRVRDAYPSFSTVSAPSVRNQFHDDFKFKISPPTPMHKIQNDKLHDAKISRDNSNVIINDNEVNDEIIELPSAQAETRVTFERIVKQKIFSKKSCPLHKNATAVKIFDDEIAKYLKTDKDTNVPTLPDIVTEKKSICERREVSRSKSTSASSTRSRDTQKSLTQERRVSKAPKLGMASLLPSFARPVSTDSSAGTTRSSFESEEELPKAQSQPDLATISPTNLLRVPPNLSFVSSHPSFHKLSLVDSVDDEDDASKSITVVSELGFPFVKKTRDLENQTVETREVSKLMESNTEIKVTAKKNMADLEKEYSYKALGVLTKKTVERKTKESSEKSSILSEASSIPDVPKFKKLMRSLDKDSSIDFREARQKLKRFISKNRAEKSVSLDLDKIESKTIYSASRSTSSLSPDFESKAIEIPSTDALERIPETKVFHRAYVDKCHACLFKPFRSETKVRRELPIAKLISVIKNPPEFKVESSSSSSTTEEIVIPQIYNYEDEFHDFPEFEQADFAEEDKTEEPEVKDHPRVSFDQSNLTKIETKVKSQLPKAQSDHHLKEKSFSTQSSDRSKTSTPSNQSSESDDARGPQDADKLPSSKFMAPCHAPIVLRKSLEPFRALKQKKFISLKARAAAITAKSTEGSESDSQEEDLDTKKPEETIEEEKKEVKKKKKKKKLIRMKSVVEKMTEFSLSMDDRDVKDKKLLKRAKTTFDLLDTSETSQSEESSEEEISIESKEIKIEKKQEELPLVDVILMHRAGSPPSPIMSTHDVIDIVKECLQGGDFNTANLLGSLSKEFVRRINEKYDRLKDSEDAEYLKLGHDLCNALIDSKRYLKPYTFDPNLKFSHKQPPLTNSRQLRRILPPYSYQLVAPILGIPKYTESTEIEDGSLSSKSSESALTFDLEVHPPTSRDDEGSRDNPEVNPYALFLKKPRRKAVVWRPLREEDMKGYDPEATLEMRATRLMDRICKEFCDWVRQLGGNEQVIDEETLKDMFEINFTSDACKSTQVVIKEMPTVPLQVVKVRHCPEANELEATRKEMEKDLKVEARPKRTFAFGRSLPRELRFVPPRTRIATKWLDCEYIPKDLENMDVVWDDIGHLDSVQEFYNFLQAKKVLRSSKVLKNLEEAVKNKA